MRTLVAALAMAACVSLSAHAAIDPTQAGRDPRIRSILYDTKQLVRLTSTALTPLQIVYEQGETPVMIAGSLVFHDPKLAKDWLASKSGNVLILQPLHFMQPSFLFVRTTTASGEGRHYTYELSTRDGDALTGNDPLAYVEVDYAYRHVPTPEEIAQANARREAVKARREEALAAARLADNATAAPRNTLYDKRDQVGCAFLAPLHISDDGHQTTLLFAPHATLPNFSVINPDGKESVVSTINEVEANGVQMTAPNVYREMRLRRGDKVCGLRNDRLDPIGTVLGGGSGTVSPDVVRQVRQ